MSWRIMFAVAISSLGCLVAIADDPPTDPKAGQQLNLNTQIPDQKFHLVEGEQADILKDGTFAATSWLSLEDYEKFSKAGDIVGRDNEVNAGRVFGLSKATKVLVVKDHSPPRTPGRTMSLQDGYRSMQNAAARKNTPYPVEVRVLDGPHANKLVFVWKTEVGRLIDDPDQFVAMPPIPTKKKVQHKPMTPKVVKPEDLAATKLKQAKDFKYDGQRDLAIEYFRKAIEVAPESKAAKEAQEILKAMGVSPK